MAACIFIKLHHLVFMQILLATQKRTSTTEKKNKVLTPCGNFVWTGSNKCSCSLQKISPSSKIIKRAHNNGTSCAQEWSGGHRRRKKVEAKLTFINFAIMSTQFSRSPTPLRSHLRDSHNKRKPSCPLYCT
jgi:hypothetical protein